MALRWTAAGMLEAERQFRRIIGYRDLAKLALSIDHEFDRHHEPRLHAANKQAKIALTV